MKTAEKRPNPPQQQPAPARGDIQTAYEVHTLAQMLYGQMVLPQQPMHYAAPVRGIGPVQPYGAQPTWGHPAMVMWGYPPRWI